VNLTLRSLPVRARTHACACSCKARVRVRHYLPLALGHSGGRAAHVRRNHEARARGDPDDFDRRGHGASATCASPCLSSRTDHASARCEFHKMVLTKRNHSRNDCEWYRNRNSRTARCTIKWSIREWPVQMDHSHSSFTWYDCERYDNRNDSRNDSRNVFQHLHPEFFYERNDFVKTYRSRM
jgi:hypothetical protein